MPSLNWIGKETVVNHDKEVPFRLLRKINSHSVGKDSKNLIIHGDNLEALKALMPHYFGKIGCIYIDPPYNTGNEKWVYNDRVNSPKIKKWLGKVVGGEAEDLCRHDKWLCMMYPRLKLLKDLLSENGAIFISIDDNEHCNLRAIMDEIFGESNFVATIGWQKKFSRQSDARWFSDTYEFIIVYAKSKYKWKPNLFPRTEEQDNRYKNPDNDHRGPWSPDNIVVKTYSAKYDYKIKTPSGRIVKPPTGFCWRYSKSRFQELVTDNRIYFGNSGNNVPRVKRFLSEVQQGLVPITLWLRDFAGDTQEAVREVKLLLENEKFDSPKPVKLIKRILQIASNNSDIILDSFAGAGTTGHAVLDLNKDDGGNRKFILIEMENYAGKITAKRVQNAIKKFGYKDGFEFCELDKTLFDEECQIEEECSFEQLATYIYFTETSTNLNEKLINKNFIGEYNETEFYLLFKEKGKNILNKEFLKKINKTGKKKIIYADRCLISNWTLEKLKIQFKQIPYEVKVY